MWHMDVLQLQLEHSFLREIGRKGQKGLLIFKVQIKSPSQAGGCIRDLGNLEGCICICTQTIFVSISQAQSTDQACTI